MNGDRAMKMNTLHISLPYEYVVSHVKLTWSDLLLATEQGWMAKKTAVQHTESIIEKEQVVPQKVLDLAWVNNEEEIDFYLNELTNQIVEQGENTSQEKFLYLLLNWIFEHKEQCSDPLQMVEIIYADFDYPEEISNFVRYMPSSEHRLSSVEASIERLFNNWEIYLRAAKIKISK